MDEAPSKDQGASKTALAMPQLPQRTQLSAGWPLPQHAHTCITSGWCTAHVLPHTL